MEYEQISRLWHQAVTPEARKNLQALALFRKPELVNRTQQMSLSDSVRTQDAILLISDLLASPSSEIESGNF